MAGYSFAKLSGEYAALWSSMTINPSRVQGFNVLGRKLLSRCSRYEPVSEATGVPVAVIAVIHERESGGDFGTHLHNGDPLNERTYHVPAGRPKTGSPPFVWEFSAIDALKYEGLDKIEDWSVERALFVLEAYNGWGYRNKGVRSPYIWGGTNQQQPGKYVADGVFDSTVMDMQPGCAPMLFTLFGLDRTLALKLAGEVVPPFPPIPRPRPPTPFPSPAQQGGIAAALAAIIGGVLLAGQQIWDWLTHLFGG